MENKKPKDKFCPNCKPDYTGKICYCSSCAKKEGNKLCDAISEAFYESQENQNE